MAKKMAHSKKKYYKDPRNEIVFETAKSSRSKCRTCQKYIPMGSQRVGTPHPEYDSYKWHHRDCFLGKSDEHPEVAKCSCSTYHLMVHGCTCGAIEKEKTIMTGKEIVSFVVIDRSTGQQKTKDFYATPEMRDDAPAEKKGIISTMHGDFVFINSKAWGKVLVPVNAVPEDEVEEIERVTQEIPPVDEETNLPTAEEVLAEEVSAAYVSAAFSVAKLKATAEINQKSLTPGMQVYHVFSHEGFLLLEEARDGTWAAIRKIEGTRIEGLVPATITPKHPGTLTYFWNQQLKSLLPIILAVIAATVAVSLLACTVYALVTAAIRGFNVLFGVF